MERSHFLLGSTSLLLLLLITCGVPAGAEKHVVGGHGHWSPNVNYTSWAAGENFYAGEWLVFYYQKGYYDVVQVNASDYEKCSAENPIQNYSRGNSFAFQLDRTGPYYFICSHGQCWGGMKLAIDVVPQPLPAVSSPPSVGFSDSAAMMPVASVGLTALCWVVLIVFCIAIHV